jgi:hypothetical protein
MIYTPQQIDNIYRQEKLTRQLLCDLITSWEYKSRNLEYSKKKELQGFIQTIDNQLDASVDLINMLYSLLMRERAAYNNINEHNEKLKRFIRNQGFNPNDLNWVNLNEI